METKAICSLTNNELPVQDLVLAGTIKSEIIILIKEQYPSWNGEGYIAAGIVNKFRAIYVQKVLEKEKGEVTQLEQEIIESINNHEILSKNIDFEMQDKLSMGERLSDKIASFGGSWNFIIIFFVFILGWITLNITQLVFSAFDIYPFILLNLILSCIAAIQAPIIMMSQNRQESKDRVRSMHDYQVNLKAELEIRHLHEKIDYLLVNQGQRILEMQKIQIDILNQLAEKLENDQKSK
jgi:uncharacterized membrane protein